MATSPDDLKPILARLEALEREVAMLKEQPVAAPVAARDRPIIDPGTPGASPHAREVTGDQ